MLSRRQLLKMATILTDISEIIRGPALVLALGTITAFTIFLGPAVVLGGRPLVQICSCVANNAKDVA
jgi:hypothetical protein